MTEPLSQPPEQPASPELESPSVEDMRHAFRLQEVAEWFDQTIEIASRPADVLNFEPASTETIAELQRVATAYHTGVEQVVEAMDPLTRQRYETFIQARTQAKQEEDQRTTEYMQEKNGTNWLQLGKERFEWKRANQIPPEDYRPRPVTPEMQMERARLSQESWVTLYIYNQAKRPDESLGVEPVTPEAAEDLRRVSSTIMNQENRILNWSAGEQREKTREINDTVWSIHRRANGEAYRAFEEQAGESIFEPLPEPEAVPEPAESKVEERKIYERECPGCNTSFHSTHAEGPCYNCALDSITHGMPPEEGDFNTASIVSGTLTEEEMEHLRKDLESVETR
ncbi:hypothetical protein JXA63_05870 [Candidatus Woesebacteria bacterium]|nr:hypothetical protein [Candidatus Woesebacteria bacterium]